MRAAVSVEDLEKFILTGFKCRVEILEYLRRRWAVVVFCFIKQANALKRLAYVVAEGDTREDHLHVLAAQNTVDALEAFAAREVHGGDVSEVDQDETYWLFLKLVIVDQ